MAHPRTAYDEKFETILRHAAVIFAEKGYHQASIRDIARATRVSLSGLYYYFQSKEELLFLIEDHALATLLANLERLLAEVDDPQLRLRLLIENHIRFFLDNMPEMKVLSHEADSLTGEYADRVRAQKRRLVEVTTGVLTELRPNAGLDLRVSAFALFGMMNWIYTWYRVGRDVPVDQLAEEITRLFLYGYLQGAPGGSAPPGFEDVPPADFRSSLWRPAMPDERPSR